MALWDVLSELVHRDARQLERIIVPAQNVIGNQAGTDPLKAGEGYFRFWVTEMFLQSDREWFHTFYPVVESLTTFQFGVGNASTPVAHVAGPNHLQEIDPSHLDMVVQVNHLLTPLVPFSGGTVQVEAGLMRTEADDLLQRFLDVVGSFSVLLAVPQLSTALNVANTVSDGVEKLLGVGSNRLMLGYQDTFTGAGGGNPLAPMYIALLNAVRGSTRAENYWVKNSGLLFGADGESATPLTGLDYMLLRIETLPERDDWDSLSTINEPWQKAIDALTQVDAAGNPRVADADTYVRLAAAEALRSPDLTEQDRRRVAKAIRERYQEYKAALDGGTPPPSGDVPLGMAPERREHERRAPRKPTLASVAATARDFDPSPVTVGELFAD